MDTKTPALTTTVAMAIALLAQGCTELDVKPMPAGVVQGIPYTLPKKSFLVSIEYVLQDCSVVKSTSANNGQFRFAVQKTVSLVPVTEPDEEQKFYIPYESLRSWFKDTQITVESYDNQTLKSVSATINDKAGETITAAIGTALRIATIVGGVALTAANTDKALTNQYCTPEALNALERIAELQKQGKGEPPPKTGDVPDTTKTPGKAAKAESKGSSKDKPAPDKPSSVAVQDDDITKQIGYWRSKLTYKQVRYWAPKKPAAGSPTPFKISVYPSEQISKWITADGLKNMPETEIVSTEENGVRIKALITELSLELSAPIQLDPAISTLPTGFILRNPAHGLLRVCEFTCPNGRDADVSNVISAGDYVVPQLGGYIVLPLRNRMFENDTLDIAISADGVITKIGLKANATAPAALGSVNTDLDAIKKAKDAQDKAKADAETTAQNKAKDLANKVKDDNKAVADCLAAQEAVKNANGIVTGTCQ